MEEQVQQLVSEYRTGRVSRRQFMKRAAQLLGGVAAANVLLLAASGAPVRQVAQAAGMLQGTAPATLPATMAATEGALAIQTSMVSFPAYGEDAPGYLARPTADGQYPAVVVIQEWWGLDDDIKNITERFAKQGYVAVAPDLYRGQVATEPNDAQRLSMAVQIPQALNDIQGAVDYLNKQPNVLAKQVGIIGFCWGGNLAMAMSYKGKNIGAVAVFYGNSNPTDDDLKNVSVPMIGFFGAKDPGFPASRVNGWQAKLQQFGKTSEMHIYPDAAHAFFNNVRDSYVADAAEDAWVRTLAWFAKYLPAGAAAAGSMAVTMAATQG